MLFSWLVYCFSGTVSIASNLIFKTTDVSSVASRLPEAYARCVSLESMISRGQVWDVQNNLLQSLPIVQKIKFMENTKYITLMWLFDFLIKNQNY